MIIYYLLTLGLITIVCIYVYRKLKKSVKMKLREEEKKQRKTSEYFISSATLKEGTCKLLKTHKGKFAICREKDKIKVFEIDESED